MTREDIAFNNAPIEEKIIIIENEIREIEQNTAINNKRRKKIRKLKAELSELSGLKRIDHSSNSSCSSIFSNSSSNSHSESNCSDHARSINMLNDSKISNFDKMMFIKDTYKKLLSKSKLNLSYFIFISIFYVFRWFFAVPQPESPGARV